MPPQDTPVTPAEAVHLLRWLTKELDKRDLVGRDVDVNKAFAGITDAVNTDAALAEAFFRLRSAPEDLVWASVEFPNLDLSDSYLAERAARLLPPRANPLEIAEATRQVASEVFSVSMPTIADDTKLRLVASALTMADLDVQRPDGLAADGERSPSG